MDYEIISYVWGTAWGNIRKWIVKGDGYPLKEFDTLEDAIEFIKIRRKVYGE